ncbi:hypothetical protein K523DRAFT_230639 [Schizophyllum commune Tattone D]|nr:hypothetical protein K523DRAFT_230639 [Schizophyllum commune Tattone D]
MAPLAAVQLTGRDVVAPPITSPNASTTWNVGETVTVTWDTSDLPPESQITNKEGKIVLGYQTEDSMHLQYDNPLAQGFSITLGSYDVTVPDVEERSDYIIVLFGDSGNSSPKFTITGGSGSSSAASPTTTANEARETTASDEVTALTSIISTPIPITGTKSLSSAANIPSGTIVTETSVAQATTAETVTQSDVTTTQSSSPSASSAASSSSESSSGSADASGTSAAADSEPSNGALRMLPASTYTASSLCAATILLALVF